MERLENTLRALLRSWPIATLVLALALLALLSQPSWIRWSLSALALAWCAVVTIVDPSDDLVKRRLRMAAVVAFAFALAFGLGHVGLEHAPRERWEEAARSRMAEVADGTAERLLDLRSVAQRRAERALLPGADLEELAAPIDLDGVRLNCGVSLWRGDEILDWAGAVPGPERVGRAGLALLVDHGSRRYLTVRVDGSGARSAYCDVALGVEGDLMRRAGLEVQPGDRLRVDEAVQTRILPSAPPVDPLLGAASADSASSVIGVPEDAPWAWIEVEAPRPIDEWRRALADSGRRVALALLLGLSCTALAAWRSWPGRRLDAPILLHTIATLAAGAGLRIGLERARVLDLAFTGMAAPIELLLDPTYFATTYGGGLARSTAEFLLTALWLATAAVALLPAWRALLGRMQRIPWRVLGWAALVAASFALILGLEAMQSLVAVNANPKLIGLDSPFFTLPFVALHVAMMLALLVPGTWVVLGWERWIRGRGAAVGVVLAVVLLLLRELWSGAEITTALWGPLLPLLGLAARPALRATSFSQRAFAGLLAVLWFAGAQSQGLERVYTGMKEDVAVAEAEQRLSPLDNWRRFLLEELLREVSEDRGLLFDLADPTQDRSNAAFELWATTVLPSHEFGSRVELRDGEGRLISEFDVGLPYEPAPLRQWRENTPMGGRPFRVDTIELPTEQGPFLVYRGRLDLQWVLPEGDASRLTIDLPFATADGVMPHEQVRSLGQQILGFEPEAQVLPRRTFDRAVFTGRVGAARVETASTPELVGLPRSALPEPGEWSTVRLAGIPYHVGQVRLGEQSLLVAFTEPTSVERILDLSRLAALYLAVSAVGIVLFALLRLLRVAPGDRWPGVFGVVGLQERLLGAMLIVVLLPVVLLGVFQERRAAQTELADNLDQVSERLAIAMQLLASNLDELAGALIGGEYVQEFLAEGTAVARRDLGPYELTQMMIFDPAGELVLDESLRDLDAEQARLFLASVRDGQLLLESDPDFGWFVGRNYPVLGQDDRTYQVFVRRLLTDEDLGRLARTVRADLTLYDGPWAVVSSQAYLYNSGLREPVLSAVARPVLEGGSRSVVDAEQHGGLLVANGWAVLPGPREPQRGILSARLLARATESAREQQQAQLFVFGLSSLAMVIAVSVGLLLSGRIVGPIRDLVGATARVGRGDLDARVRESGSDEIGQLVRSFNRMTDQIRGSQREIAARRSFLEAMLNSLRTGVIVLDEHGRVLETNAAAQRLLGAQVPVFLQRVEERGPEEALVDTEIVLPHVEGPRTLRTVLTPTALENGARGRLLVFDDVSELLASRRLALYAQMARQVAHEVKNPLTPIQLSAQMVRQASRDAHPRLPEIVDENVRQIETQVERLRNIASEFSLLGRDRLDDLAAVEVEPLLQEVRSLYPSFDGGWGIGVEAEPGLWVWASREALTKVLTNLVENARQAMGARGFVHLQALRDGDRVRIVVRDEGPGIGAEVENRLFEPYFSTKNTGTGLGLVICRSLMEKMGGRIGLRNRPDAVGAEAILELPPAPRGGERPLSSGGNDSDALA